MTVAPLEAVLATLSADSVLRRALETGDAGLLFASVWTLDPGHAGHRLWRLLDARDWQDLLDLHGHLPGVAPGGRVHPHRPVALAPWERPRRPI